MILKEIVVNGKVVGHEPRPDGELRNAVIVPAQAPAGRVSDETYTCIWIRSAKRVKMMDSRIHYGPYIAFWRTRGVARNPTWISVNDPLYSPYQQESMWLPTNYVVTRHDEDTGIFEVLLQTTDQDEAKEFFDCPEFQRDYPESDLHQQGGPRLASGRPAVLEDPVTLTFKVSGKTAERIKARAREEKRSYADLLREVAEGL